ncbi:MAG: hypothetical protein Edafosvirus30_10 [Edafosvirus sp.]|uniref:Uncharacterized protein n=1 Tax=Edafosvirus sp. TaxID=2487765 RepID=A0A3G4ZZH0_9VIRU|nr:MAG: hypothetical protein Edafosvirus30_10 [Edafosvirus sp.]
MASVDTITPLADDLEFGLFDNNLSINTVALDKKTITLDENQMENPFYVSINGSKLDKIDEKELYTTYHRTLILCTRTTCNETDSKAKQILLPVLDKVTYGELSEYFTLVVGSRNIIKNDMHYKHACRVDKNLLNQFNHNKIDLNNDEIVVLILELKENNIMNYINLYDSPYDLKQLLDVFTMYKYFNCDTYRYPIQKQISTISNSIKESEFWTTDHHINMTDDFIERSFQYKDPKNEKVKVSVIAKNKTTQDGDVGKIIDKLSKMATPSSDYLQHIYRRQEHIDVSNTLKRNKKRSYYANNDESKLLLNKEQVTKIFSTTTDEKELYNMFNTLLLSKDYCHLVLNNSEVLDIMKPTITKYMPVYRYIMGYAWLSFYIEECIFKTKSTKEKRYVYDINTANKLPVFPYCTEDIHLNPYVAIAVSQKILDPSNNNLSLQMLADYKDYGIDTLEGFKWKFNVFTTGDPTKNILDGINWDHFAVGGSVIPACVPIRSPLVDLVATPNQTKAEQFSTFFNHFYPDSDVDLMCNRDSMFDFMDCVSDVVTVVKKNLQTVDLIKDKSIDNSVEIEPVKSLMIVISTQYIDQRLDEIREYVGEKAWTVDDVTKNISSNEMKEYLYEKYAQIKMKLNRKCRLTKKKNPIYEEFYKISSVDDMNINLVSYEITKDKYQQMDNETCFYVNDFKDEKEQVTPDKNYMIFKISENIRFKIKSEYLNHNIEVFRVKSNDYFSTVARFHLPIVRAFYDGKNLYMLPSCITAMLTGICMDYKYFAGVRDPIEILNKYIGRGYGILINDAEKQHMTFYNGSINKSNGRFLINLKDKESIKKFYGSKKIISEFFKPCKYSKNYPDDAYRNLDKKHVEKVSDLKDVYATLYKYYPDKVGFDLFKFKTINAEGSVEPVKKWVLETAYNMLNSPMV